MLDYFIPRASSFSGDMDGLFNLIVYGVGFWFVLTLSVLVYFMIRFRHSVSPKAAYITGEKHSESKWVHWPHYAIIVFDVVLIAGAIMVWVQVKQTLPPKDDIIRAVGQQWSWSFVHSGPDGKLDTEDDVLTVNDLHVEVGKVYHFELQSRDVLHNFSIPAFRLKQDMIPGRTITGWFEPTQEGTFDLQCAEMCGHGHGIMGAAITVHSPESYQATMEAIQSGTYESEYLKRLKEGSTPINAKRPQVSQNEASPYTEKLLSSF